MTESLDRLESLFAATLQKPAADRAAFLDLACGDPALRRRVEELLIAQDAAGSFLQVSAPAPEVTFAGSLAERPGTVIGPYKLLQQIGEGGMGTVFMAEQKQPVRRKVALKVIKAGMDSGQIIARFEAERQALALTGARRRYDGSGAPIFRDGAGQGRAITTYCEALENRMKLVGQAPSRPDYVTELRKTLGN